MSNVTPIRPTNPLPEYRRDTITTLFATQLPVVGDVVRSVVLQDDTDGGFALVTPAFGTVRGVEVHAEVEHPSVTLRFDFGSSVTVSGTAELIWQRSN